MTVDSQTARDILTKHLRSTGKHRATAARYAVLDAVLESQGHFDAESLYYRMITGGTKISKATVYNTLDVLQECGIVSKYRFAESTSRYEKAVGRPHHHHMICLECGDILEFVNDKLERIQHDVCQQRDFTPQSSSLQIFGTCSQCRKKE